MGSSQIRQGTWLNRYLGTDVSFSNGTTWRVQAKLDEKVIQESRSVCEDEDIGCEAIGVFQCANVAGAGPPNAIIKMFIHIPWQDTVNDPACDRAAQAGKNHNVTFSEELQAVKALTEADCSSTPAFFASKTEIQAFDEWVPGGYKRFILMEHLPGYSCWAGDYYQMPPAEKDRLRTAFKTAWLEAIQVGFRHAGPELCNILWDSQRNKCYLVDWMWWDSAYNDAWEDSRFIEWGLWDNTSD
ncbi:uncharacterized protein N7483_007615 [Penicillium malachiteum]|uniref:uncharacterized protein n=1 Tax=Penicillium malachiteum TaxID=1324776 RepID=UPI0025476685|nr:uncharacterized protein N7483_007615 [Penicillium malachiteum]KAJ5726258.1 hypothetical protein N7483_007615 [Penicillium malachiteum]